MAWYRTHRPQTVAELQLPPVRDQLLRILESGQYAHAYLFAGPKGTGKTSSARILARLLNEPKNRAAVLEHRGPLVEPTSDDPVLRKIAQGNSQVVIEQDAASHRGIDDVRQLQEQISVIPSEGSIRVVILDEVHMLTTEAFNALLKMLEEPPQHVVFVLATTELHKVPATVQSRCQLVRFRQATPEEIQAVLQSIATVEKIPLEKDMALSLAKAANGSFRDAVKFFEQVVHNGQITQAALETVTGNISVVTDLLKALAQKDLKLTSSLFQQLRTQGASFTALEQSLLTALQERLHRAIQRKENETTVSTILLLLQHLAEKLSGTEPIEGLKLELACLQWCLDGQASAPPASPSEPAPKKHVACIQEEEIASVEMPVEVTVAVSSPLVAKKQKEASISPLTRSVVETQWPQLLIAVRSKSSTLEALLRNAKLGEVTDSTIELQLALPFHKERLETAKYSSILIDVLQQQLGVSKIQLRLSILPQEILLDQVQVQRDDKDALLAAVENLVVGLA